MKISIVQAHHVDHILRIYGPIITDTHISFEYTIPSTMEMWDRIQKTLKFYPWIVAIQENEVIGYAYGSRFRYRKAYDWVCEVSVYVHPGYMGRGIGSRLYNTVHGILARQGITQCIAGISLPNPPSVEFHKSYGFREVGTYQRIGYKFGQWYDVLFMQYELSGRKYAGPVVSWHELDKRELADLGVTK